MLLTHGVEPGRELTLPGIATPVPEKQTTCKTGPPRLASPSGRWLFADGIGMAFGDPPSSPRIPCSG